MTEEQREAILELCDIVKYVLCRDCRVKSEYYCDECYEKKQISVIKGVLEEGEAE